MKRLTRAGGFVIAAALVTGCDRAAPQAAAAGTAADPCAAALATGPDDTGHDRAIARTQQLAREGRTEKAALERLGYLFVARARASNDAGDYTLAEMAADCLDATYPGEAVPLLLKGHVRHQLHRFREAEQIARRLVELRTFALDYGLLGDALIEQGRTAEAAAAYQEMMDLKPFYQSYTRAAHLRWLKGDLDGAIEAMRLATRTVSARDADSSAWAWARLALYELQAGRLDDAAAAARTALEHQSDHAGALLAQGRVFLAMNRVADAVGSLRRAARLNPIPEYHWALADALRLAGLDAEAAAVEGELMARGRSTDPRTLALYLATRRIELPLAVALAEDELQVRGDVFTLDAHAWTLAASGRLDEASGVMTKALAEGTRDARLFLHAGVIAAESGRVPQAKEWLGKADALKATLLPSERAELTRRLAGTSTTTEK